MKEITLTQGHVALVDDHDFETLNQHKWCARRTHGIFYAVRSSPWVGGKRPMIRMHREVIGTAPGMDTDHINGDGLDNQRANLRACTNRENHQNIRSHLESSSRFKGVSWHKRTGKWRARIKANGQERSLGYYHSEAEAAAIYKAAADALFGAFASGARGDRQGL